MNERDFHDLLVFTVNIINMFVWIGISVELKLLLDLRIGGRKNLVFLFALFFSLGFVVVRFLFLTTGEFIYRNSIAYFYVVGTLGLLFALDLMRRELRDSRAQNSAADKAIKRQRDLQDDALQRLADVANTFKNKDGVSHK